MADSPNEPDGIRFCRILAEHTEMRGMIINKSDAADIAQAYDALRIALEESLKLQSHYAELLNIYDGGERIQFADADAWIKRLHETGTLK